MACESAIQVQCATLAVPWDHANPSGDTLPLALARVPAHIPEDRIGTLVLIPGGPGGSGIDTLPQLIDALGSRVSDRFDIVSFDPRGVGRSGRFECRSSSDEDATIDITPDDRDEAEAFLDMRRSENVQCAREPRFSLLGSSDTAKDLEQVRRALGDQAISIVGYSYGTRVATEYAAQYGDRLRALVLDGSVPPEVAPGEHISEQAGAFDAAFTRWVEWCRLTPAICPMWEDPRTAYAEVVAKAEGAALPAENRPAVHSWDVELAAAVAMYTEETWIELATALDAALAGDGRALRDLIEWLLPPDDEETNPARPGLARAVKCADQPWRSSDGEIRALAAKIGVASQFELAFTWPSLTTCVGVQPSERPVQAAAIPQTPRR